MNKNIKKGLLSIVERVIRIEVEKNETNDSQFCPVILHQPKRPKKQKENSST